MAWGDVALLAIPAQPQSVEQSRVARLLKAEGEFLGPGGDFPPSGRNVFSRAARLFFTDIASINCKSIRFL